MSSKVIWADLCDDDEEEQPDLDTKEADDGLDALVAATKAAAVPAPKATSSSVAPQQKKNAAAVVSTSSKLTTIDEDGECLDPKARDRGNWHTLVHVTHGQRNRHKRACVYSDGEKAKACYFHNVCHARAASPWNYCNHCYETRLGSPCHFDGCTEYTRLRSNPPGSFHHFCTEHRSRRNK